ncbi:MAG: trypsin-like peptidase domain-containing protein [Deltaproteobacteria bacterium]|nr:trypsin-like peptidase domain-containing protein [Deltaproteobacteria bacterium]
MQKAYKISSLLVLSLFLSQVAEARMSPRQIYKTKADGVVLIVAAKEGSSSASAGTGSIIRADGMVITNCHVIFNKDSRSPYKVVHVFLKPDKVTGDMNKDLTRHFSAKVLAFDEALDLALLQIQSPPSGLTIQTLGNPDELGPGDETVAIGHPEQGGLWTITTGVIGAEFEDFKGITGKHVFQMETSLNRGNSGGPLFDVRGYQVGVNTAIARQGQGGIAITGVNFAVKASVVKKWVAGHSVQLAYGGDSLEAEPARVASAPTSHSAEPARQPEPAPVRPEPNSASSGSSSATGASSGSSSSGRDTGTRTYSDPEGHGSITVEDSGEEPAGDAADEGEEYAPSRSDEGETVVSRSASGEVKRRKPLRFEKYYRRPPRPYTYKRLFTEVDKVRARAGKAFDDLDREIRRRGR